jgi:hypothetical protein
MGMGRSNPPAGAGARTLSPWGRSTSSPNRGTAPRSGRVTPQSIRGSGNTNNYSHAPSNLEPDAHQRVSPLREWQTPPTPTTPTTPTTPITHTIHMPHMAIPTTLPGPAERAGARARGDMRARLGMVRHIPPGAREPRQSISQHARRPACPTLPLQRQHRQREREHLDPLNPFIGCIGAQQSHTHPTRQRRRLGRPEDEEMPALRQSRMDLTRPKGTPLTQQRWP